jgi:S1-C subfamily serine protease
VTDYAVELEDEEQEAWDAFSRVTIEVAERLTPVVASLTVTTRTGSRRGSGSAVVITPDGFLVTSAHVVGRSPIGVATFAEGSEFRYEVVGTDPLSDLAVIRAEGRGLTAAVLGDADRLRVGQLVMAIGNPLGFAGSVSVGVVSGQGRSLVTSAGRAARVVENVIQTDASLHPGNSGGALADSRARVVGINTAVVGPGFGQGLGLAVPVNVTTRGIIAALMADGEVRRAWLGIGGGPRPLPPVVARRTGREQGVEVVSVVPASPAAAAGLRPEDVILSFDGEPLPDMGALQRLLTGACVGRKVTLEVARAGTVLVLEAVPVELSS